MLITEYRPPPNAARKNWFKDSFFKSFLCLFVFPFEYYYLSTSTEANGVFGVKASTFCTISTAPHHKETKLSKNKKIKSVIKTFSWQIFIHKYSSSIITIMCRCCLPVRRGRIGVWDDGQAGPCIKVRRHYRMPPKWPSF